jgi:hypothetical protein
MFDDDRFDKYEYKNIPQNQDCYLVDERYAVEYESMYLKVFKGQAWKPVGYVSFIAIRAVHEKSIELSWYPNHYDRFHEMCIFLPKSKIKQCVGCRRWDWKPTIFVESKWLYELYGKTFSVFGMVDVVGVRQAIQNELLSREKLVELRSKVDCLSSKYPDISFISFADSILIKSNWAVGSVHNDLTYSYRPEAFIEVAQKLWIIFRETLGLSCYTILTQGYNEYYDDDLLHISETRNHIALNSLGIPFAQLMSIEKSVREAIKNGIHPPSELYLDETFYHSLRLRYEYNKNDRPKAAYKPVMSEKPAHYFCVDLQTIVNNIQY